MPSGVLLALFAYALYSCCDAIIKGLGHGISVYEIAFFTTLFSLIPAMLTTPKGENWLTFWRLKNPLLVHLRAISGMIGNICIIYAFVSIQLAEAYAVAFLAPIFVVALSVVVLKETVSWQRMALLGASFIGVLIVVRPGFRELYPGHLAALGAAICGGATTVLLRRVARYETRVGLIGVASCYILAFNLIMMLIYGMSVPTLEELGWLLTIGALGGTSNILFIAATRSTPASQIAPGQYSQIAWAIVFGAVFFEEFPDAISYAGLVVVVIAGILNVLSTRTGIRIFSRHSPGGAGPATLRESELPLLADTGLEAPIAGAVEATVGK